MRPLLPPSSLPQETGFSHTVPELGGTESRHDVVRRTLDLAICYREFFRSCPRECPNGAAYYNRRTRRCHPILFLRLARFRWSEQSDFQSLD